MLQTFLLNTVSLILAGAKTPQQIQLFVLLLIITLAVALISHQPQTHPTQALVVVGLIIGISPLLPDLQLDPDIVLFLFLPVLLFEGAWNVDVERLKADWLVIFLLAAPGLLLTLLFVALLLHLFLSIPWTFALLIGAIISPTDPLAVLALFRQRGLSERLRTIVEGESLFNDGVGVTIFELVLASLLTSLGIKSAEQVVSIWIIPFQVLWLMLGGLALGVCIGILVSQLLRIVDDYLIEITITVSVAYGVYLLAVILHTSGLLAVVGAGLVLGSYGQRISMSEQTLKAAHNVWEFIGYIANSLLFLLLGVQIGASNIIPALEGIGLALVGVIIGRALMIYTLLPLHDAFARWISKGNAPEDSSWLPFPDPLPARWRPILLLAGLRGALSIALVLSLPTAIAQRSLIEGVVYGDVLVTLLGQGIGLRILLPRWNQAE